MKFTTYLLILLLPALSLSSSSKDIVISPNRAGGKAPPPPTPYTCQYCNATAIYKGPGYAYQAVGIIPAGVALGLNCWTSGDPTGGNSFWDQIYGGYYVAEAAACGTSCVYQLPSCSSK